MSNINYLRNILISAVLFLLISPAIESRDLYNARDNDKFSNDHRLEESPAHCMVSHRIGNMTLAITNNGTFGTNYSLASSVDCFTGR